MHVQQDYLKQGQAIHIIKSNVKGYEPEWFVHKLNHYKYLYK